ncbi:hypothetical protein BDW74DRAFT_177852 [Aspergillus multicolor]|uniref:uncharacterized protein n=1 Tax=Aspergillus multicolor TaxID=41759 RepID=UPI003CCD8A83
MFDPLIQALVSAILRMPKPQTFTTKLEVSTERSHNIAVEYVEPGIPAEYIPRDQQTAAEMAKKTVGGQDEVFPYRPPFFPSLVKYALVSRKWQAAVERYTFHAINAHCHEFEQLKEMVGAHPQRLRHLHYLFYNLDIPVYPNKPEQVIPWADNCCPRNKLLQLMTELASWEEANIAPRGIALAVRTEICEACGTNACIERPALKLTDGRDSSSAADATSHPALPFVSCVTSFRIGKYGHPVNPPTIGRILLSLTSLRNLDITLGTHKDKSYREDIRDSMALALEASTLQHIQCLKLNMNEYRPVNHHCQLATGLDPHYPAGDRLGCAISKLAQTSLKELCLSGLISPALFGYDPDHPAYQQTPFPRLENIEIRSPIFTYDGRWYYTGDTTAADKAFTYWERSDQNEDEYDLDEWPNSDIDSEDEDEGGDDPISILCWRTAVDSNVFKPLIRALVSATKRMPRLRHLDFRITTWKGELYDIAMQFLGPDVKAGSLIDYLHPRREALHLKSKWVVTRGRDMEWDIPDDLRALMLQQAGEGGEVIDFHGYRLLGVH